MRSVILMYHSVAKGRPDDPYGISRESLRDQVLWLIDRGAEFISLADLVHSIGGKEDPRAGTRVVLTFDDGYHDFLENAVPILTLHQLPATVFIVTDMLGRTATWSSYSQEASLMSEDEICQLKAGGIGIGSHTLTHVDLTAVDEDELRRQLVTSRRALSVLGETFLSLSYPWGRHTYREVAAVKAAGYECAVAVEGSRDGPAVDPYRLGRIAMRRDLDLESFEAMTCGPTWRRLAHRVRTLVPEFQRGARKGR